MEKLSINSIFKPFFKIKENEAPIYIIQTGESSYKSTSKKAGGKNINSGIVPTTKDKKHKTSEIDLGEGEKKLSVTCKVLTRKDVNTLIKGFEQVRTVFFRDKFRGDYKVFIDSFSTSEQDSSIGLVTFKIDMTIVQKIDNEVNETDVKIADNIKKLENIMIESNHKIISPEIENYYKHIASETVNKFAESINIENCVMQKIDDIRTEIYELQTRINRGKSLGRTLKRVQDRLLMLYDDVTTINNTIEPKKVNILDNERVKTKFELGSATYSTRDNIIMKTKFELVMSQMLQAPFLKLEKLDNTYSSRVYNKRLSKNYIGQLMQMVVINTMLNAFLNIKYKSSDDAIEFINNITNRLDSIDMDNELRNKIKVNLEVYIASMNLPPLKEISVNNIPLIMVCYEIYGNVENLLRLKEINNLVEIDNVNGVLKVYQ